MRHISRKYSAPALTPWGHWLTELVQHRQIRALAFLSCLRVASNSTRHAVPKKRQLARDLIAAHARAPAREAMRPERVPGHSHPAANCAKFFVLLRIEKAPLVIRVEKLADDTAFAAQRKENHHQSHNKRRPHD